MPNRAIIALKVAAFLACLGPLGWLVYGAFTNNGEALGADPTATITHTTGDWTIRLILITLAITPIRRLIPSLGWLIRFRRMIGLYAFFYGTLHLFTWIWLYSAFNVPNMLADVAKRRFITVGMLGWALMIPLAITSGAWAIRWLGGKRWNRLHMLIYATAICGVIHYWWLVKPGVHTPMTYTLILTVLLLFRVIWSFVKARKKPVVARLPSAVASS
jgi:methionine sulfoxide reductase heme-binding subunit